MLLGMGTVFVFLGVLILATQLMSRLVRRYQPAPSPAPARKKPGSRSAVTPQVRKAIELAIAQYRNDHR